MSNPPRPPSSSSSVGPLVTAIAAVGIATVLLGALLAGAVRTLSAMLILLAPGIMLSSTGVAVSMGWIFLLVGRQHRQPAQLKWTVSLLAVAMVELLLLILLTLRTHPVM